MAFINPLLLGDIDIQLRRNRQSVLICQDPPGGRLIQRILRVLAGGRLGLTIMLLCCFRACL